MAKKIVERCYFLVENDALNAFVNCISKRGGAQSVKSTAKLGAGSERAHFACEKKACGMHKKMRPKERKVVQTTTHALYYHRVYRNGKVRFWLRPHPQDTSLIERFEEAMCRKGITVCVIITKTLTYIKMKHVSW